MLARICKLISTLLMIILLILALLLVGPVPFGLKTLVVLSGSMEPTLKTGGIVYIKEVQPQEIAVDDIVTFTLSGSSVMATHRVIEIDSENSAFITKGDANETDDGPVTYDRLIGKVVFSLPFLGVIVTTIQSRQGILVIAGVLILLILVNFLPGIFRKESPKQTP